MTPLQAHELSIQRAPDLYTAMAFRGRGVYDRRDAPTYAVAVEWARKLYRDRPVAIYAVRRGLQSHITNYEKGRTDMHAFLISHRPDAKTFAFAAYDSAKTATAALESLPEGMAGSVVAGETDLRAFSGPQLVGVHNQLRPTATVARFATLQDARRRVFDALTGAGLPVVNVPVIEAGAPAPIAGAEEEAEVAAKKKEKKARAPREPKAAGSKFVKPRAVGKVADLKVFRAGSDRANVLQAMDGKKDAAGIAAVAGVAESLVRKLVWFFGEHCGIGTDVDDKGRLTAVYPGSKTFADVVPAKA